MTWIAMYLKHHLNEAMDMWVVTDTHTKRLFSGITSEEAHAIAAALNGLEGECYE